MLHDAICDFHNTFRICSPLPCRRIGRMQCSIGEKCILCPWPTQSLVIMLAKHLNEFKSPSISQDPNLKDTGAVRDPVSQVIQQSRSWSPAILSKNARWTMELEGELLERTSSLSSVILFFIWNVILVERYAVSSLQHINLWTFKDFPPWHCKASEMVWDFDSRLRYWCYRSLLGAQGWFVLFKEQGVVLSNQICGSKELRWNYCLLDQDNSEGMDVVICLSAFYCQMVYVKCWKGSTMVHCPWNLHFHGSLDVLIGTMNNILFIRDAYE